MLDMEQAVYRLLRYLKIYFPQEIDLEIIAEACKTEIRPTSFRSHCATHPKKRGWHVLFIKDGLPYQEWRQTVAHELSHPLIHFASHIGMSDLYMRRHEAQADRFAEYLLVPFYMFKHSELCHINYHEQGIHWVMEQFNVPYDLAELRWLEWNDRNNLRNVSLNVAEEREPYIVDGSSTSSKKS